MHVEESSPDDVMPRFRSNTFVSSLIPTQGPRRVLCDCLDCRGLIEEESGGSRPAWKAAALQEPAPKCLVFFLDVPGHNAWQSSQSSSLANLNAVARDGRTGHLALRKDAGSRPAQKLSALAQLLGVHKGYSSIQVDGTEQKGPWPPLSERYRGLAAGVISDCEEAVQVAQQAGCSSCRSLEEAHHQIPVESHAPLPSAKIFAMACLRDLGLLKCLSSTGSMWSGMDALMVDDEELDLLLVHLTGESVKQLVDRQSTQEGASTTAKDTGADSLLSWVDALCGELDALPNIKESLLLVVLMTVEIDAPRFSPFEAGGGPHNTSIFSSLQRPRQSYEFAGHEEVGVQKDKFILFAQRLNGVIRQDTSTGFSYEECQKGAGGGILLERLLPEIAYKLGRAHKLCAEQERFHLESLAAKRETCRT